MYLFIIKNSDCMLKTNDGKYMTKNCLTSNARPFFDKILIVFLNYLLIHNVTMNLSDYFVNKLYHITVL